MPAAIESGSVFQAFGPNLSRCSHRSHSLAGNFMETGSSDRWRLQNPSPCPRVLEVVKSGSASSDCVKCGCGQICGPDCSKLGAKILTIVEIDEKIAGTDETIDIVDMVVLVHIFGITSRYLHQECFGSH